MNSEGEALTRLRAALPRRSDLDSLEKDLLESEARVRLLDRASPPSLSATIEQFSAGKRLDASALPALPLGEPSRERRVIAAISDALGRASRDLRVELLLERALELHREIERAAALGSSNLVELTRALFARFTPDLEEADGLCAQWIDQPDDQAGAGAPELAVLLEEVARAAVDARRIPVRVVAREMSGRAAAGPGTLFVQRRLVVPRSVAARVILHELEAHILPRLEAPRMGAPFSIGPEGADLDEEGFALTLEQAHGFLGAARRRELGLRHRAARRVLAGVAPDEIVSEICDLGEARAEAIRIWARAARGPGLCRDLYYLIGFVRTSKAFAERPRLRDWFRLGRMSAPAAIRLDETLRPAPSASRRCDV